MIMEMKVLPIGIVFAPEVLTKVVETIIGGLSEPARTLLSNAAYMNDLLVGRSINTRRQLLSFIGKCYDPVGVFDPIKLVFPTNLQHY